MTDRQDEADRRETAARWFAELQAPDVRPETWESFLEWESDPANATAYREIEATIGVIDRTSLSRPGQKHQSEPGRGRRPVVLTLTAAAAALIIGAVALTLHVPKPDLAPLIYATAIGEQETVPLEDGSILTLNTNTKLTVSYSKTERLIRLEQGEALFEVEHSDRPFLVKAGGTITRALGTEFDIRSERDSVSVTLINGSVRVRAAGPENEAGQAGAMPKEGLQEDIVLKPGERLDLTPGTAPRVSTIDPSRTGQWRDGLLQFDNTTLADAIAEMNRYSTVQLRIDDEILASERISGTFPAGKQAEFAESLRLYRPVEIREQGHGILIVPSAD
jgi:transmembrane sensor